MLFLQAFILLTLGAGSVAYASQNSETFQGGATTLRKSFGAESFAQPAANIPLQQRLDFNIGQSIFEKLWVSSPSSTTASDGLGPLYNARSCAQCHIREGRGHPPEADWPVDNAISMLLRLSIPAQTQAQQQALNSGRLGVIPEPNYGHQLQDFAVSGLAAEGHIKIRYTHHTIELSEGEQVELRQPHVQISEPAYGPLHPQLMLSARIAPPMIGLGLLEAIPEADILALSDPDDQNNDGISGRPNRVWDTHSQSTTLGRFGWKAGMPTLQQQNTAALHTDIGISSPDQPGAYGDCTQTQQPCLQLPNGNSPHHDNTEASAAMLRVLLFYTQHLAVPAQRNATDQAVQHGRDVFYRSGCQQCHQPSFTTAETASPLLRGQKIWPYTDLLLHDMGAGLADQRPEFQANGLEWRTPPLWGIGLTAQVGNGKQSYLHDGRARSLLEAILWHGGEAATAQQQVVNMSRQDRHNLIKFLESL